MKNFNIGVKIWILVIMVSVFGLVIILFGQNALSQIRDMALEQTSTIMMDGHKGKLKALVDSAGLTLAAGLKDIGDPEERLAYVREMNSKDFFYQDKSGYFGIYTTSGTLISLPPKRKLEGKDLSGLKDSNDVYIVRELVQAAKSGGGFVKYVWPKPGSEKPQPKLTYAGMIPDTDYVIATGIYIDDVRARQLAMATDISSLTNRTLWWGLGTVVAYFSLIILPLVFVLIRQIARPIRTFKDIANELAAGNLSARADYQSGDEIGALSLSLDAMADNLKQHANLAEEIAAGNLSVHVSLASPNDQLGLALRSMVEKLNSLLSHIQTAGKQINSASEQVADSSQSLSQGATETAASLEEISSSMNEMASQISQTSENANQANQLSSESNQAAEKGTQQMETMVAAMTEINDAGQSIGKIIKVIDEIAFQTNLLALNAAVEAARAGQHGKGFAVVAEEVRNLAARSAKAASETSQLIEGSVEKTRNGTQIAEQTAKALEGIVGSIGKVNDLVGEIAAASHEQAQGISQVNIGLTQIDQGVQQSTATAEESAAAAEELSSQAAEMKHMLERFTLSESSNSDPMVARSFPAQIGWGVAVDEIGQSNKRSCEPRQATLNDHDFGKY